MLVGLFDVLTDRFRDEVLFRFHFVLLLTLALHGVQQLIRRASIPIDRPEIVYQKLQQQIHVLVLRYHQINVPVLQRQRNTLPAVKGLVLQLVTCHGIEVLAEHPEARVRCSEVNGFDVVDAARGTGEHGLEVLVCVHLLVGEAEFHALSFSKCGVFLLTKFFYLRWISFKHMLGMIDRFPIINIKIAAGRIKLYKHVKAGEVLHDLLQRVVELEAHQPLALQVVHDVEDLFYVALANVDFLLAFLIGFPMIARRGVTKLMLRSYLLFVSLYCRVDNLYRFHVFDGLQLIEALQLVDFDC